MKTNGQRLYEHRHPTHIRVIPVGRRHFATEADVMLVPNPQHVTPWHLLTERVRMSYEWEAEGHHLFMGEQA